MTSSYGPRNTGIEGASTDHKGLDLRASEGSTVYTTDGGTVYKAGNAEGGSRIIIQNKDGSWSWYRHVNPSVKSGDKVSEGDPIGTTCTGPQCGTKQPHLHYERAGKDGKKKNPTDYLREQYEKEGRKLNWKGEGC